MVGFRDTFKERMQTNKDLLKNQIAESEWTLDANWITSMSIHIGRFNESLYPDMNGNEDTDNQLRIRFAAIECMIYLLEPTLDKPHLLRELESIKTFLADAKDDFERVYQKDVRGNVRGKHFELWRDVIKRNKQAFSKTLKIVQLDGSLRKAAKDPSRVLATMGMS